LTNQAAKYSKRGGVTHSIYHTHFYPIGLGAVTPVFPLPTPALVLAADTRESPTA